jgi:hypothetical protein
LGLFGPRRSPEERFWEWFSQNDLTIFAEAPPGVSEEEVKHVTFLLLDNTIGEHAMIYKVRYVDFEPMSLKPETAVTLDELPSLIDISQY